MSNYNIGDEYNLHGKYEAIYKNLPENMKKMNEFKNKLYES